MKKNQKFKIYVILDVAIHCLQGLALLGKGWGFAETLTAGVSLSPGVEEWELSQTP